MKVRISLLSFLLLAPCSQLLAQEGMWIPEIKMDKTMWLAGEPITCVLTIRKNTDKIVPFAPGRVYLDGESMPCYDRDTPTVTGPPTPEQTPTGDGTGVEPQPQAKQPMLETMRIPYSAYLRYGGLEIQHHWATQDLLQTAV